MFGQVFENVFIYRVVAFGIVFNRYKDIFYANYVIDSRCVIRVQFQIYRCINRCFQVCIIVNGVTSCRKVEYVGKNLYKQIVVRIVVSNDYMFRKVIYFIIYIVVIVFQRQRYVFQYRTIYLCVIYVGIKVDYNFAFVRFLRIGQLVQYRYQIIIVWRYIRSFFVE